MSLFSKHFETYNEYLISRSKILSNYESFKNLTNKAVIPVLKSNAYGFGLLEVGGIFQAVKSCNLIAVDSYFEALKLSSVFHKDILIMGAIRTENFIHLNQNFHYVVGDFFVLESMAKTGKIFKIHIEFDTGMNRHGFKINQTSELERIFEFLKLNKNIKLEGVMTHLYDVNNEVHTRVQFEKFKSVVKEFHSHHFYPNYIHISATGGSFYIDKFSTHVRVGAGIYGINPFVDTSPFFIEFEKLTSPVGELVSTVNHIVEAHEGELVGYDGTLEIRTNTRIATIPFGYYEGLQRIFSNLLSFQIKEHYFKIAGNVCMNICMINIENGNVKIGDIVKVYSSDRNNENSFCQISKKFKISEYELAVKVSESVRRTVVD